MINASQPDADGRPWPAYLALLIMSVIWGVNFSVSKVALDHIAPLAFNALRFPLGALLLYIVLRSKGPIPRPQRSDWPRIIVLGLVGNLLYQLCFIFGLDRTSASNAALLLAGTPIVTALLSAFLGQERVTRRMWFGVFSTFAGIVLIVLGAARGGSSESTTFGNLLMLGAIFTWAFYTVGGRPLVDRYGAVPVTAWSLWIATFSIVVVGLPSIFAADVAHISAGMWAAIVYAGALSIGLSYIFYYYGLSKLGNTRTASYSNIVPVFALLCAWLWLGHTPRLFQLVGAAVIIGGVTIAQSESRSRTPTVSPEV